MTFFKREIRLFYTALRFYTRIPCPSWVEFSADYTTHSSRYFPLIGILVGTISAVSFYLLALAFHPLLALLLMLCVAVLLTGAFHEDGLADTCDGFGGGYTKEKMLEIMKDSRIGTYGFMGLFLVVLIKITALNEFALEDIPFMLICGNAISRFTAISFVYTHEYSRADDSSKSKAMADTMSLNDLIIAATFGIVPLFCFLNPYIFLVLIPVYLCRFLLGRMFVRGIGGYTGDCLGATQQISEIVFYLSAIVILRFIPWN